MPIVQLPLSTTKLLSSSQVITSVSSAVKELVENSLDAGARSIEVKLTNYGLDKIEVQDNGCGVSTSDAEQMCLSHYTSKIFNFADLSDLKTYGFRGEALSSLCNVADVTITTRTATDPYAASFCIGRDGAVTSVKPSHFAIGTTVAASNIFSNLPVRKQYMSSSHRLKGEFKKAEAVVKNLALINTSVHFTFLHNKCAVWQKPSSETLKEAAASVFGYSAASQLEEISSVFTHTHIKVLLPKYHTKELSALCCAAADAVRVFFNRRPVIHRKLEKTVLHDVSSHFRSQCPQGKYPACVVSIEMPASELDVNLEPNKTKILSQNEDDIISALQKLISSYYKVVEKIDISPLKRARLEEPTIENSEKRDLHQGKQNKCDVAVPQVKSKKSCDYVNNNLRESVRRRESTEIEATDAEVEDATKNESQTTIDDLWNAADKAMGAWSKGCIKSSNGDVIKGGSRLLLPEQTHSTKAHTAEGKNETKRKGISLKKNGGSNKMHLFNTSHHSVCSQMGKKEYAGFTRFSRESRPKIISENPGVPFTNVATILAKQWQNLSADERNKYESPCEDASEVNTAGNLMEAFDNFRNRNFSQTCDEKTKVIDVTLEDLRGKAVSAQEEDFIDNLQIIGQLPKEKVWLYRHSAHIGVVRHWALQEKCIYKTLMSEHSVPVVPLEFPIRIDEDVLGQMPWNLLMTLGFTGTENVLRITNPLIVKNGFVVEKKGHEVLLTHTASTIRFYGMAELREVLQLAQHSSELSLCRPVKVAAYLKSEAVRITQQAPPLIEKEQLMKLLNTFVLHDNLCLHHKPILEIIYTIKQCSDLDTENPIGAMS